MFLKKKGRRSVRKKNTRRKTRVSQKNKKKLILTRRYSYHHKKSKRDFNTQKAGMIEVDKSFKIKFKQGQEIKYHNQKRKIKSLNMNKIILEPLSEMSVSDESVDIKDITLYCGDWDKDLQWTYSTERESLGGIEKMSIDDVVIHNQIGSSSANAIVFRAKYGDVDVAIKFFKKDDNELAIANIFGEKSRSNLEQPYLITFGSGDFCESNKYKKYCQGDIKIKSYKEGDVISEMFSSCPKLSYLISELAGGDFKQLYEEINKESDVIGESKIKDDPKKLYQYVLKNMPFYFMSVIDNNGGEITFEYFSERLMCSLVDIILKFHKDGYIHGDIHHGNFMVLKGGKIVIHDFGKSKKISELVDGEADKLKLKDLTDLSDRFINYNSKNYQRLNDIIRSFLISK